MSSQINIMTLCHWIIFLTIAGLIQGQSIISGPKRVTAKIGESAEFGCEVDFEGGIQTMQWLFNDQIIYAFEKGKEDFPWGRAKYSVTQNGKSFSLVVKELDFSVGGKYTCIIVTDSAAALLIILDTPKPHPPSPDQVEETRVQFICKAKFAGPSKEEDFPQLLMYFDDNPLDGPLQRQDPEGLTDFYEYTMVHNITLKASMNGKKLVCDIKAADPVEHANGETEVRVLYSVRNTSYSPKEEEYEIGTALTCTAEGNPEPQFVWEDLGHSGITITGNSLEVSEEMMGSNVWKCTARNTITGKPYADDIVAVFETVLPVKKASDSWKIAVGIIVVVCVVVIILAVLYVLKKKKRLDSLPFINAKSKAQQKSKSRDGNASTSGNPANSEDAAKESLLDSTKKREPESQAKDLKDPKSSQPLLDQSSDNQMVPHDDTSKSDNGDGMPVVESGNDLNDQTVKKVNLAAIQKGDFKHEIGAEGWLHSVSSENEIQELLKKDGDCLITFHDTSQYMLSFLCDQNIGHTWIKFDKDRRHWTLDGKSGFPKLNNLVFSIPGNVVTVNNEKVTLKSLILRKEIKVSSGDG